MSVRPDLEFDEKMLPKSTVTGAEGKDDYLSLSVEQVGSVISSDTQVAFLPIFFLYVIIIIIIIIGLSSSKAGKLVLCSSQLLARSRKFTA